ncbi:hypothetical protein BX600DRAFT_440093 [Xylariales sp. PMI_506]|nr:hypothetical protein BX600DRAFT_440093 [Xylariales sp. PMI_506]
MRDLSDMLFVGHKVGVILYQSYFAYGKIRPGFMNASMLLSSLGGNILHLQLRELLFVPIGAVNDVLLSLILALKSVVVSTGVRMVVRELTFGIVSQVFCQFQYCTVSISLASASLVGFLFLSYTFWSHVRQQQQSLIFQEAEGYAFEAVSPFSARY